MYKKTWSLNTAILLLVCSITAQADVIVNTNSTTDTAQGLEFLHVGQTTAMTFTTAQAGITYDGFTWQIATVDQFLALMEGATGTSIPAWDGSNLGDVDFDATQALAMMAALDGGNSSVLPGFWVDGETFGESQVYAHTGNDDFHLAQGPNWGSTVPVLFIRAVDVVEVEATPVPTMTQWGLILLTLLVLGLASARLYRRA